MGSPAARKNTLVIMLVVLGAAIGLGLLLYRGGTGDAGSGTVAGAASRTGGAPGGGKLSTDAVLSIAPGAGGARQAPKRTLSPALQEYATAKAYEPLYKRINASPTRTAEEQWMLAQILQRCAKVIERPRQSARWALGGEDSKARFAASLSEKDPDRDKRIAAFEQINVDSCAGLTDIEVSEKDIYKLLEIGASGGDPKSRAAIIEKDLLNQMRGPDGKVKFEPGRLPTISASQVDAAKQAFASGDPYAMQAALSVFTFPLQNFSLRVGPNEMPVDMAAWHGAVDLLTCDFGRPCGPDSQQLLNACAMQGRCGATDYREYMFFYTSAPSVSQQIGTYNLALLNAARTGDWTYFTFHNGPAPNTAAYMRP